eukprot:5612223-Lingulodinium_polyedra.AAC.1
MICTIGPPVVYNRMDCGVYSNLQRGVYNKRPRGVYSGLSHGVQSFLLESRKGSIADSIASLHWTVQGCPQ